MNNIEGPIFMKKKKNIEGPISKLIYLSNVHTFLFNYYIFICIYVKLSYINILTDKIINT